MSSIKFFNEDIDFKLPHARKTSSWIKASIQKEKKKLAQLNYIFCSDKALLEINRKYLSHNYYTDIITFDLSETTEEIIGEIYISVARVRDNASKHGVLILSELLYLMSSLRFHFGRELRRP